MIYWYATAKTSSILLGLNIPRWLLITSFDQSRFAVSSVVYRGIKGNTERYRHCNTITSTVILPVVPRDITNCMCRLIENVLPSAAARPQIGPTRWQPFSPRSCDANVIAVSFLSSSRFSMYSTIKPNTPWTVRGKPRRPRAERLQLNSCIHLSVECRHENVIAPECRL